MTRWLITGAGGALGSVLLRQLTEAGHDAVGIVSPTGPVPHVGRTVRLDLLQAAEVTRTIETLAPSRIVHTAALTHVAGAFHDPAAAQRINVDATGTLVGLAASAGIRFALVSTEMVFDGEHAPYDEESPPNPTTVYGRTKLAAEHIALAGDDANIVVVRVPLLYGLPAVDRSTTFGLQVRALQSGTPLRLFEDEVRSPLWLEDAALAITTVVQSDYTGLIHAGGPETLTRVEMGRRLTRSLGLSDWAIIAASRSTADDPEPRPRDLTVSSARYTARFGAPPGRPMAEALAATFAR
jgi:dTDP-4-dehydrorhamnose reductase